MKKDLHLIAVLALLTWPCAAQDTSSNATKPAAGGNVTSHSQGLHGYIGFTRGKLVALDPALLVTPPPGLEVG